MPRQTQTDNRRPDTEALLTGNGISFTYAAMIPLDQVERYADAQSRLDDTIAGDVRRYAEQMRQGAIFPPVILWPNGYENYGLVDGNTRVAAKRRLGLQQTDAYIIEVGSPAEAVWVSAMFNATNGHALSKEEVRNAIVRVGELDNPPTNERIAQRLGISPGQVTKLQNVHRTSAQLVTLGIDPDDLNESNIAALSKIGDSAVKRDLAQLIIDSQMRQSEVRDIVKDVVDKGSEAERLAVVAAARTARQDAITAARTGRVVSASPQRDAAMAFGRLTRLISEYPDPAAWVPVDQARRMETGARISSIVTFLDSVAALITEQVLAAATDDAS